MPEVDTSDIAKLISELDDIEICPVNEIYDAGEPVSLDDSPTATVLIHQYEQVVAKSLITSFGLDGILFHDKKGGDVDTLVTVRDSTVEYADKANEEAYNNRGIYDSHAVHSDSRYIAENRRLKMAKKAGNLYDAYTGKRFAQNADTNLDHIVSAKERHDDPARVLAGMRTEEAANVPSNFAMTEGSINKSKNALSAEAYMEKLNTERETRHLRMAELRGRASLTDEERAELSKLEKLDSVDGRRMMTRDRASRAAYDRRLARAYYPSTKFLKSTASAALSSGVRMGMRQTLGLLLTEVWCTVREEFPKIMECMRGNFDLGKFLRGVADAFKKAFQNVKEKFKALIASFRDGALSGIMASITTTIINMFTVTAKNIARILRETWSSLLEAFKILFLNPDDMTWGERLRAATKVLAIAASVIVGGLVQEWVYKFIAGLPLGDIISIFVGSLVSGILSVSFVYFVRSQRNYKEIDGVFRFSLHK